MKKIVLIFFFIFINLFSIIAKDKTIYPHWQFYGNFHYGYILKHRPVITHLTYQHVSALCINVERPYQIGVYKFGVSFMYLDYRNDIVGKEIGVTPYFKTYFHKSENGKNKFGVRIGVGLGYFTEKFDRHNNYKNLLISTHLNGIIQGKVFYEDDYINIGMSFTHASNGAFKMPNYGVNVVSISGGVILPAYAKARNYWNMDGLDTTNTSGFIFEIGNALKETFPTEGKKYWVNTFTVLRYKQLSKMVSLTGGVDFVYNRALLREQEKETWRTNFPDVKQIGLNLGTDVCIGKINATVQYGYNFYMPYKFEGKSYSKLGLKYRITNQIASGIRLKANGGKADFVEWTIHYKI